MDLWMIAVVSLFLVAGSFQFLLVLPDRAIHLRNLESIVM